MTIHCDRVMSRTSEQRLRDYQVITDTCRVCGMRYIENRTPSGTLLRWRHTRVDVNSNQNTEMSNEEQQTPPTATGWLDLVAGLSRDGAAKPAT
jgi:hypothetical protein